MSYNILLTNGDGNFQRHFSADEFGILETSITMFLIYTLFIVLGIAYAVKLYNKQFLHVTFQMFIASVVIEWLSFLFYMSEYGQFSQSGLYTPGMLVMGRKICVKKRKKEQTFKFRFKNKAQVFDAVSQIVFLLMLILLAKGYTVTRGKLRKVTAIKLTVFFAVYLSAYMAVFICAQVVS